MRPLLVTALVLVAIAAFVIAFFIIRKPEGGGGVATPGPVVEAPDTGTTEEPAPVQPVEPSRTEAPKVANVEPEDDDPAAGPLTNSFVGLVINERDEPVAGAKVKISRDALSGDQMANLFFIGREPSGVPPLVQTTDKDGRYVFRAVPPAKDYFLLVEHPDYSQSQEENIVITRQGESRGPDVVLTAGSRLTGHVFDVGGNAVPKARLDLDSAYMMGIEIASPDRLSATTDASGYFEFNNVAAGPRNLSCSADGYGVQIEHNVVFKGDGSEALEREFRLSPGHPIGGRVFGPDNEGIQGVKITALNYASNKSSRGTTVTGEDGVFTIDGLEQGSYILLLEAVGYRQARQNRVQVDDMNVQIEMLRQASINGRVVGSDGAGVQDFTVALHRVTPNPRGQGVPFYEPTNVKQKFQGARGDFTLAGVDPGTYALKVTAGNHAPRMSEHFVVADGKPTPVVNVTLSHGGSIRGRVVDPGGRPITGAQVMTRDDEIGGAMFDEFMDGLVASRTTERKARTNDEGFFDLKLLNPGQYRIVVEHASACTETVHGVVVTEGQQTDAGTIGLRVGGTVRGKVLDRAGRPLARAMVRLFDDAGAMYQTRTDNEGRYLIEHIVPASYKLSATRSGSPGANEAFDVIVDQQNSLIKLTIDNAQTVNRDLSLGN